MQIVIEIDDRIHYGIEKGITVNGSKASQILIDAVKNGTPLPKGHGRLIDELKAFEIIANGKEGNKAYFGTVNQDWKVIDMLKTVPTIIEADMGDKK